jgi:transposase
MEVLSSSSITTYILPLLSVGSRGKTDEVPTLGIVQAILYRLKTGCQWRFLPLKEFFGQKDYTRKPSRYLCDEGSSARNDCVASSSGH